MKYRLHIWQATRGKTAGQWYWHIKHVNGKVVAQGESYKRRGDLLTMLGRLFRGTPIEAQADELRRKK